MRRFSNQKSKINENLKLFKVISSRSKIILVRYDAIIKDFTLRMLWNGQIFYSQKYVDRFSIHFLTICSDTFLQNTNKYLIITVINLLWNMLEIVTIIKNSTFLSFIWRHEIFWYNKWTILFFFELYWLKVLTNC